MEIKNELHGLLAAAREDYWGDRLAAEAGFVEQLAAGREEVKRTAADAMNETAARVRSDRGVTSEAVAAFEAALAGLGPACKAHELVCAGHAHIDMNWMWGFHETVTVTVDTFRTVLELLDRYPQFHFSQSQAAVYQIVELYAPQLVEPIRRQIAAGRWEVTATQWVESDMNLPSGESLARQMLYSRRYLLDTYGAPEEAFELVFLPDTFGHSANTPELLAAAGVRYLYHCRGAVGPHLSRWEAPSGRSLLVYREPRWYNTDIDGRIAEFLPRFAKETGVSRALCLYGVGDHGGGPTVRDIERLADMAGWPLFPTITFGTLRSYFERIAASGREPERFRGERNMIFTGCYSSQSRIKAANRTAEKLLYETELDIALARALRGRGAGDGQLARNLRGAWTRSLFSHFHDILPGSGIEETREFAMGSFQESAAAALAAQSEALRRLSGPGAGAPAVGSGGGSSRSEGAGAGFGAERFRLPAVERGSGPRRLHHLYNPLQWARETTAEITVWDWQGDPRSIECLDGEGRPLDHRLVASGKDEYWGHRFLKLQVRVHAPGFGYAVVEVHEAAEAAAREVFFPYGTERWLVEHPLATVLENSRIRAIFDPLTMRLRSLYDKSTEAELVAPRASRPGEGAEPALAAGTDFEAAGAATTAVAVGGLFRLVEEEADRMTAWVVGRYQAIRPLDRVMRITETVIDQAAPQQSIAYELAIAERGGEPASRMAVRVSLDRDAGRLRFDADCHWLEAGAPGGRIPQLQYALGLSAPGRLVRCDVPFGTVDRPPAALDVPANSFAAVIPESGDDPVVQLTADTRQAFRFDAGTLSLTLLRSSVDPDPYPELGRHRFSFSLAVLSPAAAYRPSLSLREALESRHPLRPLSVSGGGAPGRRGRTEGGKRVGGPSPQAAVPLLSLASEGCVVSAVKTLEPPRWSSESPEEPHIVVRLYEVNGAEGAVEIRLPQGPQVKEARLLDLHERPAEGDPPVVAAGVVRLRVPPFRVVTLELTLDRESR